MTLQWRHNEHGGVSNHQPHGCLLNRLFKRKSKKTSKPCYTGLCAGNSPETGEFPAQRASNAENISIWSRHHGGCTGYWYHTWWKTMICLPRQYHAGLMTQAATAAIHVHYDVIKWKYFSRYYPFVRGIHRWPSQRDSNADIWCFLICAWTDDWVNNRMPVIWDAVALIMTSL